MGNQGSTRKPSAPRPLPELRSSAPPPAPTGPAYFACTVSEASLTLGRHRSASPGLPWETTRDLGRRKEVSRRRELRLWRREELGPWRTSFTWKI